MKRTTLTQQVKDSANCEVQEKKEYDGDVEKVISTGSTLLDLAISGGRVKGGGIPGGILAEVFGPSGCGKTVLLCELAGSVQRQGGMVKFRDPEARLNKQFARIFDVNPDEIDYDNPNTVPEVFEPVRSWEPKPEDTIHGIFADSLAALTTDWELENKDAHGMRRAKEFSQECRKTCRVLENKNFLMVCSNQLRQNIGAGQYAPKYLTPGGEAIGYYSSLRLKFSSVSKIKEKRKIAEKEVEKIVGVCSEVEVFKSSVWKPYNTAPVYIVFDYGIDDIRANLQYLKTYTKATQYMLNEEKLGQSMNDAIAKVEELKLEAELKDTVITLWEEIEEKFRIPRTKKRRI